MVGGRVGGLVVVGVNHFARVDLPCSAAPRRTLQHRTAQCVAACKWDGGRGWRGCFPDVSIQQLVLVRRGGGGDREGARGPGRMLPRRGPLMLPRTDVIGWEVCWGCQPRGRRSADWQVVVWVDGGAAADAEMRRVSLGQLDLDGVATAGCRW